MSTLPSRNTITPTKSTESPLSQSIPIKVNLGEDKKNPTKLVTAAHVAAITVSGIDLSQYMQPPSNQTPFERFLREEDRLGELSSSPWRCRVLKL